MISQGHHLLVCACLVISLFPGYANAQASKEGRCTVEITKPKTGESVGAEVLFSGVARIPAGTYLWVFAHRKGLAIWWPQGGGAAAIENGKWSALITFGRPQDRGAPFEVAALVVDHATHAKLEAWFKQAEGSGSYTGMRLPVFVEGCEPPKITVTKAN